MSQTLHISLDEYPQETVTSILVMGSSQLSKEHSDTVTLNLDTPPAYTSYRLYKRRFFGILGLVSYCNFYLLNYSYPLFR